MTSQVAISDTPSSKEGYFAEYGSILKSMQYYLGGGREGKGELMSPGFHTDARIAEYRSGQPLTAPFKRSSSESIAGFELGAR